MDEGDMTKSVEHKNKAGMLPHTVHIVYCLLPVVCHIHIYIYIYIYNQNSTYCVLPIA